MEKLNGESNNLSQFIYQQLRRRLIVGDLSPNDSLSIRTLAKNFGVSTMPVREALKRLETENALTGSAKRAYRVPDISSKEAANIIFVRATLEGAGTGLAIKHIRAPEIERLRQFSNAMDAALKQRDAHGFLLNNFYFHSLIYRSTHNTDLSEIVDALYARSGPWLGKAIREVAKIEDWVTEHHDIVNAIEARDAPRVRALIEADAAWGITYFMNSDQLSNLVS